MHIHLLPMYELRRPDCVRRMGGLRHPLSSQASKAAWGARGLSILSSRVCPRKLLHQRECVASLDTGLSLRPGSQNGNSGSNPANRNEPGPASPGDQPFPRSWTITQIAVIGGLIMIIDFAVGVVVGVVSVNPSNRPAQSANSSTATLLPEAPGNSEATNPVATTHAPQPSSASPDARDNSVEVIAPEEGSEPTLVTLPQQSVSASDSIAIGVRQSMLVPAESGPASEHRPKHAEGGRITGPPLQPLPLGLAIDPNGDVVRLRVSVDEQGAMKDLTAIDGRADLMLIAEGIVSGWLQTPARIAGKPIASTEDVTVTFRPAP